MPPVDLGALKRATCLAAPFTHWVVDGFLKYPQDLTQEFLAPDSKEWLRYDSDVQVKMACNNWNLFPPATYSLFSYLISDEFVEILSKRVGCELFPDPGLHGGGWHCHGAGGVLKPHLDYSIHPKLGLQRKVNLLIYVEPNILISSTGGHLGFWEGDEERPHTLYKSIPPTFNRAVLFDTTQNSWHGMISPFKPEPGVYRRSLAVYYLCEPDENAPGRLRAEFYGDNI